MSIGLVKLVILMIALGGVTGCTHQTIKESPSFQLSNRIYLYQKDTWSFHGKLVASNQNHALSALFNWQHVKEKDTIDLVGFLGLGQVRIEFMDNHLEIKQGSKHDQFIGDVDRYLSAYMGMQVPVSMLKYWLRGLPSTDTPVELIDQGFIQNGWTVKYLRFKQFSKDWLPVKIRIEKKDALLKVFVKLWQESTQNN